MQGILHTGSSTELLPSLELRSMIALLSSIIGANFFAAKAIRRRFRNDTKGSTSLDPSAPRGP